MPRKVIEWGAVSGATAGSCDVGTASEDGKYFGVVLFLNWVRGFDLDTSQTKWWQVKSCHKRRLWCLKSFCGLTSAGL